MNDEPEKEAMKADAAIIVALGVACLFQAQVLCSPLGACTRMDAGHAMLQQFRLALAEFERVCGRLPTEQEGLRVLVDPPENWPSGKPWKPILLNLPRDPWGSDYRYIRIRERQPGYGVFSVGADQVTFSDGNDPDDLNTWNEATPWFAYYGASPRSSGRLLYFVAIVAIVSIGAVPFIPRVSRRLRPR